MEFFPSWPLNITPLVVFGLMLIIGAIGGYTAHRSSWIPSITGFMVVGFICGPSGIGLLGQETINGSRILVDIALALILYRLGLSLDIRLLSRSPGLLMTSLLESGATFGLVFYVLSFFDMPAALAALLAAITVSSSPAVLLHVAHEVGAKGEVTETAKTLVALNNLFSFFAFSVILSTMLFSSGSDWATIVLQPLYGLVGSLIMGLVFAFALHTAALKVRKAPQYKLALVIGTIMAAMGLAQELKLSTLFVPLVIGVVIKSVERETVISDIEFGSAFELFFIVLFVFAGAGLHIHELIEFAPAVFALVFVRSLVKVLGVTAISVGLNKPFQTGLSSGMLLVPMAGLAIGLVLTSSSLFPQHATTIAAIVLGAVTVFETIGPPIAAYAFRLAGEAGKVDAPPDNAAKADVPQEEHRPS